MCCRNEKTKKQNESEESLKVSKSQKNKKKSLKLVLLGNVAVGIYFSST